MRQSPVDGNEASVKRIAIVMAIQLPAAAAGILILLHFQLTNLLQPSQAATEFAALAALGAIILLTISAPLADAKGPRWLAAVVAATLIVGFAPAIVDTVTRHATSVARRAEDRRVEAEFLSDLAARKQDVAARISDGRPYKPEEAFDFIWFVSSADLNYRGLPDYSGDAFALLKQALEGKIVDPNGRVQRGPWKALSGAPLFLYFYEGRIRPAVRANAIDVEDWKVLELLVVNGADLTIAEAVPLRQDLQKTPVRDGPGRFMRLQ
jgi:hypothetical protein